MMRNMSLFCVLCAVVVLSTSFQPIVGSTQNFEKKEVVIETSLYHGLTTQKTYVVLTEKEVRDIKENLMRLSEAIKNNDEETIFICKKTLEDQGVLPKNNLVFLLTHNSNKPVFGGNISNSNCVFSALGEGHIIFKKEAEMFDWIFEQANQQDTLIGKIVVLIIDMILFGIPVMIMTHLIPFRIKTVLNVELNSGRMTTDGTQGHKTVEVHAEDEPLIVNLTSFTGITISPLFIQRDNSSDANFVFTWGWAAEVTEVT